MPTLRTYHLFISHAWKYGSSYDLLINLLDNVRNFSYKNYSAPQDNPLQNLDSTAVVTEKDIEDAIDRKIRLASCILVISGMYYNNRRWMQYELESASKMGKPILAVKPWGNERVPSHVQKYAVEVVNWNGDSIVSAIRRNSL